MAGEASRPVINVESTEDKMDIDETSPTAVQEQDDGASESTLVNEPGELPPPYTEAVESEDYIMVDSDEKAAIRPDKENMPPTVDVPTNTASALRAPLQPMPTNVVTQGAESATNDAEPSLPQAPNRPPPPIPPRPERKDTEVDRDLMFGRQQDVTECIGNVMFQIEAAIKPEKLYDNGEQVDIIKE